MGADYVTKEGRDQEAGVRPIAHRNDAHQELLEEATPPAKQ